MKKFIRKIFILFFILLLVDICFYYILYENYYKPYDTVNLNYTTYLLADSHGTPLSELLDDSGIYNFSFDGDSYADMLRKLKFLIEQSKVKRILITVDGHTLSEYREKNNNLDRSTYFENWDNTPDKIAFITSYIKKYIVFSNAKSRDFIRSYIVAKILTPFKGHTLEQLDWGNMSEEKREKESAYRYITQFKNKKQSEALTSDLYEIVSICDKFKIKLFALKFPLSRNYLNILGNNNFDIDKILNQGNVSILNYKYLYQGRDELFYNQDHLNYKGAQEFAKILEKTFR